jgi:hypothetical protein
MPADPDVDFIQTLTKQFGAYYSFEYTGGLGAREQFDVQSYSVFATTSAAPPQLNYGADLHVVFNHDVCEPTSHRQLQWIQVVYARNAFAQQSGSVVDNLGRANPFYVSGGLTSIFGDQVINFADTPQQFAPLGPDPNNNLTSLFLAEVFLVEDTGTKDFLGKEVIEVLGGIKWGWQVEIVP